MSHALEVSEECGDADEIWPYHGHYDATRVLNACAEWGTGDGFALFGAFMVASVSGRGGGGGCLCVAGASEYLLGENSFCEKLGG